MGRLVPLGLTGDQVADEAVTVSGVDVRLVRYVFLPGAVLAHAGGVGRGWGWVVCRGVGLSVLTRWFVGGGHDAFQLRRGTLAAWVRSSVRPAAADLQWSTFGCPALG